MAGQDLTVLRGFQRMQIDSGTLSRAEGCLLGQLAGDSLGSLVEFQTPAEIRRRYPDGVRKLENGGTWGTIAGQPTDDSEMALILARTLIKNGRYDANEAREAYVFWLNSHPFDCGSTVSTGLRGFPNRNSQANGAMMRISPLGIFCSNCDPERTSELAQQDASLMHPHPVCLQANALFAMSVAAAISTSNNPASIYENIKTWALEMKVEGPLLRTVLDAADSAPDEYCHQLSDPPRGYRTLQEMGSQPFDKSPGSSRAFFKLLNARR